MQDHIVVLQVKLGTVVGEGNAHTTVFHVVKKNEAFKPLLVASRYPIKNLNIK